MICWWAPYYWVMTPCIPEESFFLSHLSLLLKVTPFMGHCPYYARGKRNENETLFLRWKLSLVNWKHRRFVLVWTENIFRKSWRGDDYMISLYELSRQNDWWVTSISSVACSDHFNFSLSLFKKLKITLVKRSILAERGDKKKIF